MLIDQPQTTQEVSWRNPREVPTAQAIRECELTMADVQDAADRLARFASFFRVVFSETGDGILESPLRKLPAMDAHLQALHGPICDTLWLKQYYRIGKESYPH